MPASMKVTMASLPDEEIFLYSTHLPSPSSLLESWILNSGTSRTMSCNRSWFTQFTLLANPIKVTLGDTHSIYMTGISHIYICMHADNHWRDAILQQALFVPNLHSNLLSISYLTQHSVSLLFSDNFCSLCNNSGTITCKGYMSSNLYIMDIQTVTPERVCITKVTIFPCDDKNSPAPNHLALLSEPSSSLATLDIWHCHLGHVSSRTILCIAREGLVNGMIITGPTDSTSICKTCLVGKQSHINISKSTNTCTTEILGCVFLDICSKLLTQSHQKFKYFATFTDDKLHKVFIARLKLKSDLLDQLKIFIARVKCETGKQLKILWSNSGGEYTGNMATKFFKEHGIKQEITTTNTSQHNGVAECMNYTLLDKVRTMLTNASLPNSFWYDTLKYATTLHNSLSTKPLPDITPEEAWSGNKPNIL
jgi:GAG-pre-integrase domain